MILAQDSLWTSDLQNCKRMHLCHLRPLSLRQLVTAATGNWSTLPPGFLGSTGLSTRTLPQTLSQLTSQGSCSPFPPSSTSWVSKHSCVCSWECLSALKVRREHRSNAVSPLGFNSCICYCELCWWASHIAFLSLSRCGFPLFLLWILGETGAVETSPWLRTRTAGCGIFRCSAQIL